MRNLPTRVPKNAQSLVATLVRSTFAQPDAATTRDQHRRVVDQLRQLGFGRAADLLADSAEDLLAFTAFPKEQWRQIWSNNPQERLNEELRGRTDVVGIFPNRDAVLRLVGLNPRRATRRLGGLSPLHDHRLDKRSDRGERHAAAQKVGGINPDGARSKTT